MIMSRVVIMIMMTTMIMVMIIAQTSAVKKNPK